VSQSYLNLGIFRAPLKSQAHQGTSLFMSAECLSPGGVQVVSVLFCQSRGRRFKSRQRRNLFLSHLRLIKNLTLRSTLPYTVGGKIRV